MGNSLGTKITSIKEEIDKKIDETKIRIDETIRSRDAFGHSNTENKCNDTQGQKIPKISITGIKSDLSDESVLDTSLREGVTFDDIREVREKEEGEESQEYQDTELENCDSNYTISAKEELPISCRKKKNTRTNSLSGEMSKVLDNLAKTNKEVFASLVRGDDKKAKQKKKEILCIDDICFQVDQRSVDIAKYCIPLLQVYFCGQTTSTASDKSDTKDVLNLGLYLKLVDKFLRQFETVEEFSGEEEEYLRLLKLVSLKRRQKLETTKQCFNRILSDSERFVKIYHRRGVQSERLHHKDYWGSKQQLLSAKVIADWVDPDGEPLDPIFGAILQPTSGRCGPGDSGWIHNILFDDSGHMAYHSAVHDAFGYLINYHNIGPGYDYIGNSRLDKLNPLSGQISGVKFWKEVIQDIECQHKVVSYMEI